MIFIKKGRLRAVLCLTVAIFLSLASLGAAIFGAYGMVIPETVACFSGADVPSYLGTTFESDGGSEFESSVMTLSRGSYKLFGAIPVKSVTVATLKDTKVHVGGVPFGLKFLTKGVSIVGFEGEQNNTAFKAGLRLHDTIIKADGRELTSASDLTKYVEECGGRAIKLTYLRAGKEFSTSVNPTFSESEKKYTLGIWLKDSGAGIGTITFVTEDGTFGGLGHGVCETDTGELIEMTNGQVLGVTVSGVIKGQRGTPGELRGYFNSSKVGKILKNTDCGVFGVLTAIPEVITGKAYSIGLRSEVQEGAATLLCTLDGNVREEYSIAISDINRSANGNKCFTVKITDERLIAASGGIVQGMSGSPIIQNGKLIGAVTHVLINDPTIGYGIFIENMLTQTASAVQTAA